jgi:hypothetical protein
MSLSQTASQFVQLNKSIGPVAQWSEQGTHNPLVVGSIPTGPTKRRRYMNTDIVSKLRKMLSWNNAEEAITEIESLREEIRGLRKMVADWKETAEMLAIDLGNPDCAIEVYIDIKEGLYDKIRNRMQND